MPISAAARRLLAAGVLSAAAAAAAQPPRNVQTFFPSIAASPFVNQPPPRPPLASPAAAAGGKSGDVAAAVVVTAVVSFVVYGLLFAAVFFCCLRKRSPAAPAANPMARKEESARKRPGRPFVDENGLDAIYWSKMEKDGGERCEHCGRERSVLATRSGRRPPLPPKKPEKEKKGSNWEREERRRKDDAPLMSPGTVNSSAPVFDEPSVLQMLSPPMSPPPPARGVSPPLPLPPGRYIPRPPAPAPLPALQPPSRTFLAAPAQPPPLVSKPNATPPPPAIAPALNAAAAAAQPPPAPKIALAPPPPPAPKTGNTASLPSSPLKPNVAPPPPPPAKPGIAPPPPPAKPGIAPPPPPAKPGNAPPPPPPAKPGAAPPPPPPGKPGSGPPPPAGKPGSGPPPPPGKKGNAGPPAPPGKGGAQEDAAKKPTPLKALHWDKLNADNFDHSLVWDNMRGGSFKYEEGMMEMLFGAATAKRMFGDNAGSSSAADSDGSQAQVAIIESRKSQNIAIVLRTLATPKEEIIDALVNGSDLNTEVIEKVGNLGISKEEQKAILAYKGDPSRLPATEAFVLALLRAVPSAFDRLNALLVKATFASEIAHFRMILQTLTLACQELKSRGVFLKLLEAVLKAGNRMNAGTARGNAQAFNLNLLIRLGDIKSTDQTTNLLHFIVEEVVRSEGKRLVINRNHSLRHSGSLRRSGSISESPESGVFSVPPGQPVPSRDEKEREYITLGLPIVGGLSTELSNVRKAAVTDYGALTNTCSLLGERIAEIKKFVDAMKGGDPFAQGMRGFLAAAKEELSAVRKEQEQALALVQRTTEYYHASAAKDKGAHPLELFMIVREFLGLVDQSCVEIKRKLQEKRPPLVLKALPPTPAPAAAASPSPEAKVAAAPAATAATQTQPSKPEAVETDPSSKTKRVMPRFPNLPQHFMKDNSEADSSSDEED